MSVFYDRRGFSLAYNWDMDYLRRIARLLSDHYHETLGCMYVYQSGVLFSTLWPVASAFIDERTRCKIRTPATLDELRLSVPEPLIAHDAAPTA